MLTLQLLGGLELHDPAGTDLRGSLTQPKRLALLAYLAAATPLGFHRRDTLLALLWPDLGGEAGRGALRQALHYLRSHVDPGLVVNRGTEEVSLERSRISVDVLQFREAHAAGRWQEAEQLYRGEFLPGFHCAGTETGFAEWLDQTRRHLRRMASDVARRRAEVIAVSHPGDAAAEASRAVELGSLDEGLIRAVMQLLDRSGDRASALRIYTQFTERLSRELGVEPSAVTRALAEDLRGRR